MDTEIRLGLDKCSITEAMFAWNGQNNEESVVYIMKKRSHNT